MKIKKAKGILKELKEERKNIKEFSMFGDNNWETLDLEINYLERLLKKPTDATLQELEDEVDVEIMDIENEMDIEEEADNDDECEEMNKKRQPLQNILSIFEGLK